MHDFQNNNYSRQKWGETFVGVEKKGGSRRGVCYVVRVPYSGVLTRAIAKKYSRDEAEKAFLEEMDKQGGWEGEVPFRDLSYKRKRK